MPADCRLYLLTPPRLDDLAGFAHTLAQALDGGDVAALQIRLKDHTEAEITAAALPALPVGKPTSILYALRAHSLVRSGVAAFSG